MNALWPDLLQGVAALLTGASVVCVAVASFETHARLHRRFLARVGGPLERSSPSRPALPLPRSAIALLAVLNERWLPEERVRQLRGQLAKAGRPRDIQPAELVALMELSCAAFAAVGAVATLLLDVGVWWALLFAAFGAAYPLIWLRDRINARHHQIARALPYDLDLLTLSVEAGLDFTAAIAKVVEKGRPGPLADELSISLKELKLGKMREEALKNLARRCELPTLTTFVQALVQADKMGTPLGKTLRLLSTQMRVERTQRAEKLANQAPVKLLLPLIACIFPTIFLMLFGPIFFQVFLGGSF